VPGAFHSDIGSAARFFYCAKTSPSERHEGLMNPGPQFKQGTTLRKIETADKAGNIHPTVKPVDLMAYLVRLVTPPGGTVLDPFMGSGSTGKAAMREGMKFIGIELETDYLDIARSRIEFEYNRAQEAAALAAVKPPQLDLFSENLA
jgi:site-specific DNA-methyltransferase (adenine-specific)